MRAYGMNCRPNQISEPKGTSQMVVSLIATKTTVLSSPPANSSGNGLKLEEEMHRRADAMTDVLTEIMNRPSTPRFWGLNE